jgi:hypothetical protein
VAGVAWIISVATPEPDGDNVKFGSVMRALSSQPDLDPNHAVPVNPSFVDPTHLHPRLLTTV